MKHGVGFQTELSARDSTTTGFQRIRDYQDGKLTNEGKEKRIVVRIHPEVALQILEQETGFLSGIRKRTRMKVDLLDDPLMRQDEFRLLAGPAETDVTDKYVTG